MPPVETAARPSRAIRWSAVLFVVSGVGVGVVTPVVLSAYQRDGVLPEAPFGLDFRMLSGPLSESLSREAFIALGLVLVACSIADVLAGVWLWRGERRGAVLGLVTSPIVFAFGIGFAVPFILATAGLRVALILAGWSSLSQGGSVDPDTG
jgi:hypothetical protein